MAQLPLIRQNQADVESSMGVAPSIYLKWNLTSQGGGDLPTMSEAQQLAQALIAAAQNAASASAAHTTLSQPLMTQLSAQSSGDAPAAGSPSRTAKFAHASKMVRMPDPFTAVGAEAEQTAWPDFELNLLAWLGAADTEFETDLQCISNHVDTEFDMDVHSDEMAARSKELHSILVGLLRNRSLKVLRGVSGRNGYEVYRQLLKLFKPSTKPRAMALLSALMSLPTFGKDKSLYDHIQGLDRLMSEYQKASGLSMPDEVSLSVLVRSSCTHSTAYSAFLGPVFNICYSLKSCNGVWNSNQQLGTFTHSLWVWYHWHLSHLCTGYWRICANGHQ